MAPSSRVRRDSGLLQEQNRRRAGPAGSAAAVPRKECTMRRREDFRLREVFLRERGMLSLGAPGSNSVRSLTMARPRCEMCRRWWSLCRCPRGRSGSRAAPRLAPRAGAQVGLGGGLFCWRPISQSRRGSPCDEEEGVCSGLYSWGRDLKSPRGRSMGRLS